MRRRYGNQTQSEIPVILQIAGVERAENGTWTARVPAVAAWNGGIRSGVELHVVIQQSAGNHEFLTTDEAWSVPGTAQQPPPDKGRPNPSSDYIEKGRWVPAFIAQKEMLDEHSKKYNLEKMDWRPAKPWYKK